MRWGIERRLAFIDFRLYWEGRINRKDLTEFFGISVPQASTDLRKYQEEAPDNVEYDKSAKFYYATKNFKPIFTSADSSDYLAQLRLLSGNIIKKDESFLSIIPSFDTIPNPIRSVDSRILRRVVAAIKDKMSVEILYQSMSRDQPIWRRVTPHTLAYDGYRWHFRAFCYVRNAFLDFLFPRVLNIRNPQLDEIDPTADLEWSNFIEVRVAPHPGLTEAQKRRIESDYEMKNGIAVLKVRAALYFYFEKHFGLDEECESREAKQQQIILLNRDEVEEKRALYRTNI